MKIQISAEQLQKKLPYINHAVSLRSQLPILLNLLLEAKEGKLSISATDLEIGIKLEIFGNVEEDGEITVPARVFSELIASLPSSETITLQTIGTGMEISSKRTTSTLQAISADEFPSLYEEKGETIAVLGRQSVVDNFSMVIFAADIGTIKPQLAGMMVQKEENGFLLVATDGYRLSLKHLFQEGGLVEEKHLLIPARVIKEACNMKEDGDITISVSKKNNQVLFAQKETTLVGRLIESEFPNYEKIIPTDRATTVTFSKTDMQKAVKTCSIFARETANIIKFALISGMVVVSANTPSLGENKVEVEAQLSGEENEIAFNAKYLLDLFANVEAEEFVLEMTGPLNPGVFKIAGDDSFLHIIMPIKVQE